MESQDLILLILQKFGALEAIVDSNIQEVWDVYMDFDGLDFWNKVFKNPIWVWINGFFFGAIFSRTVC